MIEIGNMLNPYSILPTPIERKMNRKLRCVQLLSRNGLFSSLLLLCLALLMPACNKMDDGQSSPSEMALETPLSPDAKGKDTIIERGFVSTQQEPISTFSVDVDRAAYSLIRSHIEQGQLPPTDIVRIEEMINYFPYPSYSQPTDAHPMAIHAQVGPCPWAAQHRLVHIGLQARKVEFSQMPPANLVFLVDVSGSMADGNKLPLVKTSLKTLLNQLRENDRVALVTYAGDTRVVLPATPATQKERIRSAIDALGAGGGTNGGSGIELAYEVAKTGFIENGVNRVILATDGDFNIGTSSDTALVQLIEQKRKTGIYLSVLGYGMGNYRDGKMEKITNAGNGNYAYIDTEAEAQKALVTEIGGTLMTVATDAKIQVHFDPTQVESYRLIGYDNRRLNNADFDNDQKDAGDVGAGHTVTALYEIVPKSPVTSAQASPCLTVSVRYKPTVNAASILMNHAVIDQGHNLAQTSDDFRFSAAVAAFGLILRQSAYRGEANYDMVLELVSKATTTDPEGYRQQFIALVERAKRLK
jgi:Ca-activated chloride channel homolog